MGKEKIPLVWREWIHRNIGGSKERIMAAHDAAWVELKLGKGAQAAVDAARRAVAGLSAGATDQQDSVDELGSKPASQPVAIEKNGTSSERKATAPTNQAVAEPTVANKPGEQAAVDAARRAARGLSATATDQEDPADQSGSKSASQPIAKEKNGTSSDRKAPAATNQASAELSLANNLLAKGNIAESEALFTKLVSVEATAADAFYGLGVIYLSRKQIGPASLALEESLRRNPKNANAYYYLGVIWQQRESITAAIGFFRTALETNPDHRGAMLKIRELTAKPIATADRNDRPHLEPVSAIAGAQAAATAPKLPETPPPISEGTLEAGVLMGRVANLLQRQEIKNTRYYQVAGWTPYRIVWYFRLHRLGQDDSALPIVEIALESPWSPGWGYKTTLGLVGCLFNGDWVLVDARKLNSDNVLWVHEVWNLTTNQSVRIRETKDVASSVFLSIEKKRVVLNHFHGKIISAQQRQNRPGCLGFPLTWCFRVKKEGGTVDGSMFFDLEISAGGHEHFIAVGDEIDLELSGLYGPCDFAGAATLTNLTSNRDLKLNAKVVIT